MRWLGSRPSNVFVRRDNPLVPSRHHAATEGHPPYPSASPRWPPPEIRSRSRSRSNSCAYAAVAPSGQYGSLSLQTRRMRDFAVAAREAGSRLAGGANPDIAGQRTVGLGGETEQNSVDLLVGRSTYGVVEPEEAAERVTEHDPFSSTELRELCLQELEPAVESGFVSIRQLRIEHDFPFSAQHLGEWVLPAAGRPPVLDTMNDQEPSRDHRLSPSGVGCALDEQPEVPARKRARAASRRPFAPGSQR